MKQESIPVGSVPTAAVATTRCQYRGGGLPIEGKVCPTPLPLNNDTHF